MKGFASWGCRLHITHLGEGGGAYCTITRDSGEKAAFRFLTRDAQEKSLDATPRGAFVKYLQTCRCVDEVKARVASLAAVR